MVCLTAVNIARFIFLVRIPYYIRTMKRFTSISFDDILAVIFRKYLPLKQIKQAFSYVLKKISYNIKCSYVNIKD